MKRRGRWNAFETGVGKYSSYKVDKWRPRLSELEDYLTDAELSDDSYGFASG